MPSDRILMSFDQLLAPLSSNNPCGENLRYDTAWAELSDLRKTRTDPVDPSRNKIPDWNRVVGLSCDLLENRTKDLLLAGWLTEALLRTKGFPGLRDGLQLINGFIETYWETVFPLPDEGDLSIRMAPLTWLTSEDSGARLSVVMREVPLAPSSHGEPLHWNYFQSRRAPPQVAGEKEDVYKKRVAEADKRKQTFDSAVESAPIRYYQTMAEDMDACSAEIDRMKSLLDLRLGEESPNWRSLRASIEDIRTYVQEILKRRGGLPADVIEPKKSNGSEPVTTEPNYSDVRGGPVRSRADAIARLEEVAEFFSTTEPHSPVSYLVRRSIRWAGMPFAEVLNELVKDDKLVKQIGETLGIPSGPTK